MKSDWKKFTAKLEAWRERYLAERTVRIAELLTDEHKTPTERFWEAEKMIREEARTLCDCLDDYSRSTMWLKLLSMRRAGMIQREDLAEFSEELQQQVFDERFS